MASKEYLQQLADKTKNAVDIDALPPQYEDPNFSGPVMSPEQQRSETSRAFRSQLPPDPGNQTYGQQVWGLAKPLLETVVPGGSVIVPGIEKAEEYRRKIQEAQRAGKPASRAIGEALGVNGVGQAPEPQPQEFPDPSKVQKDQPVGADDDHQGMAKAPPNMPASQWVAAHEVAAVDPQRQADLQDALASEAAARLQAGDIAARGQEVGAEGQMQAAQQELADEQRVIDNQRTRQDYLDKLGADIEADSKDLANANVDPEHFWHSRTTGQQIMGIIGMALGGFLQGFKGGHNPAADMIESAIQNDIGAQRSNLENKWQGMRMRHSILADKAARYQSLDVAERQQVAARLQGAMLMAQAAAARATSPIERANAQALAAQLEAKAVESGIQMNRWVQAGYAGAGAPGALTKDIKNSELVSVDGQLVYANSAEEASAFRKRLMAGDELESNAQEILSLMDKVGPSTIMHGILGDINARIKMLGQSDTAEQLTGSARGGLGLMKYISSSYEGASSLNPYARAKARGALSEFLKHVQASKAGVKQELAGNPIVQRIQDPAKQKFGVHLTGQVFDPSATPQDGGPGPQVKGFRPAGSQ